jgi:hypothetical protein
VNLWPIVGLIEVGIGALLVIRPALGRYVFAVEFHDRVAGRFPRLYRVAGYSVLKDGPEFCTKGFGVP